ncbi:MAG: transposase [Kofleriaceae bacterium]|nr:transposase [Kofleriaceae bacterium]
MSAHKSASVKRGLVRNSRFTLYFTPTYSSWVNLVERFFALFTEEAINEKGHLIGPVGPPSTSR